MNKFFKYSLPIGIAGIALNLLLLATNWYYELVIPIFENTMDDGPAFTFIDHFVNHPNTCLFMNNVRQFFHNVSEI